MREDRETTRGDHGARRRNPLLRLFSSVTFGVTLLALLLAYASVVSAVPQVRLTLEMTEMQAFRHWLFITLVALFCVTLCVTTWTRIRWNLTNLGVLTVHSGLLLLTGGAAWYFGNRVEGSVLLRSPRLEVVQLADASQPLAEVPLEVGKGWAENLPNSGGLVGLRVAAVAADHPAAPREVRLQTRLGDGPVRELVVAAAQSAVVPLNDKLGVRIRAFPPEDRFYDGELVCLHYRRVGDGQWRSVPLPQLPIYRARFVDDGSRITDARGATVISARQRPHMRLFGLEVPTGWIEHWRMPIVVEAPDLPFDVVVDGYLPYLRGQRQEAAPGGDRENPVLEYTLGVRGRETREFLSAFDPARSLSRFAPLEFRWVRSREEAERLLSPLAGPRELSIELKDPPLRQVVAVQQGQTLRLEGTPYELTIDGFQHDWAMASPQLRGASSPVAMVSVNSGTKKYQRTVVQRFPEFSQDIDETGKRHNDGPYDSNLVLRYRTGADAWAIVVAGESVNPELGVFQPDGNVRRYPLRPGERNDLGGEVAITLNRVIPNARELWMPVVEPVETRRPDMQRQVSSIRVRASGRGPLKDWSESQWIMHTECVHLDWKEPYDRKSVLIRPPGSDDVWEFAYGPAARPLGYSLVGGKLTTRFFPGTMSAEWWRSDFLMQQDGAVRSAAVETNQTFTAGKWTFFQSGADFDEHWGYTVLGVGNRLGIWPMVAGSILVPLGCLYAFYVKPVLIRRRKRAALAAAEGRRPAARALEPVEVT